MESREIINIGKTGAATTIDYRIDHRWWFPHYREMMTLFLRQGGCVESITAQVISDALHLTLVGEDGNLLYMKIDNFFDDEGGRLPITGDFVLQATKSSNPRGNLVADEDAYMNRVDVEQFSRDTFFGRARVSEFERHSYHSGRNVILSENQFREGELPVILSLGLSSLSIPVTTTRHINCPVQMPGMTTEVRQTGQTNQILCEEAMRAEIEATSLPLILHISNGGGGYRRSTSTQNPVSLLCNYQRGIVYETKDNPLDLAGIQILCELEEGDLRRSLSKISKKRPFGLLELHCDVREAGNENCCLKVINLVDNDGEEEYETQNIRKKKVALRYLNDEATQSPTAVSTNYGRIMDIFLSNRRGNPSMARIIQSIKQYAIEPLDLEITELIGVSESGRMIVGFEAIDSSRITDHSMTAICTISPVERDTEVDMDYLSASTGAKKVSKSASPVEAQPPEEPEQEIPNELLANVWYRKWKEYSDGWHTARGQPSPTEITPVFMAYMNSGEMDQEDIDEYNRLLQE
tara:strand:+ start:14 stop:1579 length:1566 start_codon:yes stop_codon:yes gene_type:complete